MSTSILVFENEFFSRLTRYCWRDENLPSIEPSVLASREHAHRTQPLLCMLLACKIGGHPLVSKLSCIHLPNNALFISVSEIRKSCFSEFLSKYYVHYLQITVSTTVGFIIFSTSTLYFLIE